MDPTLKKLFRQGEILQLKMRVLFIKNKIEVGKVEFLPKKEFKKWKLLYEKSNLISKEIAGIIEKNNI